MGQASSAGIAFQGFPVFPCALLGVRRHCWVKVLGQQTPHPKNPHHWNSSSGRVRLGAGLIRLQWGCGGSQGQVMGQVRLSCTHGKAEAVPQSRGCHLCPLERGGAFISVLIPRFSSGGVCRNCGDLLVGDFGSADGFGTSEWCPSPGDIPGWQQGQAVCPLHSSAGNGCAGNEAGAGTGQAGLAESCGSSFVLGRCCGGEVTTGGVGVM